MTTHRRTEPDDPYQFQPCPQFTGEGPYCCECGWLRNTHDLLNRGIVSTGPQPPPWEPEYGSVEQTARDAQPSSDKDDNDGSN